MNQIIITNPTQIQRESQAISIEQYEKRRVQRRRRVAKRLAKRFPMFAVEMMQNEFPGYTYEEFETDISRKTRKGKRYRRAKSPLKRQGRYPLYEKALSMYHLTRETKYMAEAQYWRNRLFLPFELVFVLKGEKRHYEYHSTTTLQTIEKLKQIKGYSTWAELDEMIKEETRWSHIS